jgi:hypothetical protein
MINKLIVAVVSLVVGVAAHAAPIVKLTPSSSTVIVGSSFTVDIEIDTVTDLYAWEMDIGFGPTSLVNVTGQAEGPFLGAPTSFFLPGTVDNVVGTITYIANSLVGAIPGVTGSGTLATLTFDALSVGLADFSFSRVLMLDSNLSDIFTDSQVDWIGGRIEIVSTPTTQVPVPPTLALLGLTLPMVWRLRRRRAG